MLFAFSHNRQGMNVSAQFTYFAHDSIRIANKYVLPLFGISSKAVEFTR